MLLSLAIFAAALAAVAYWAAPAQAHAVAHVDPAISYADMIYSAKANGLA